MRDYIITPMTGLAVVAVVGATTAYSAAKGGVFRVGIKNEETGEVPVWGDFRALTALGALGLNLLPMLGAKVPMLADFGSKLTGTWSPLTNQVEGGVPLLGSALRMLTSEDGQDFAALMGTAAATSYAATEGIGIPETGQFLGLPVPQFVMDWLSSDDEEGPALPAPDGDSAPAIASVLPDAA